MPITEITTILELFCTQLHKHDRNSLIFCCLFSLKSFSRFCILYMFHGDFFYHCDGLGEAEGLSGWELVSQKKLRTLIDLKPRTDILDKIKSEMKLLLD